MFRRAAFVVVAGLTLFGMPGADAWRIHGVSVAQAAPDPDALGFIVGLVLHESDGSPVAGLVQVYDSDNLLVHEYPIDPDGHFYVDDRIPGVYTVVITPDDPNDPITITRVEVIEFQTTEVTIIV